MATPSCRQVLVHLDPTLASGRRLAAARDLAGRLGAAVNALYAATPGFIELPYASELGAGVAAELLALDERRRERAAGVFAETLRMPGPAAQWGQTEEVPIAAAFAQQALFADLLVLGQHDPGDDAHRAVPPDFVELVLAISGRPALVIPFVDTARPIGETVVVAWKETREAARAVSAAVPLLKRAGRVHVLAWQAEEDLPVGGARLDLDGYLGLHGVKPTWHRGGAEPAEIGELILSRASDLGADLLVMGCYGHGRAREWMLGGASRTILRSMTLPVLMAH